MNNPDINDICKEIEEKLKLKKLLGDKIKKKCSFEPDDDKTARIIVVGIGNSGNSIINRIIDEQVVGVEFIGINTDKQALQLCKGPTLVQIGEKLTNGLGAGGKPEIGESAAKESSVEIVAALKDADIVFIICGMGGGTGTGAAPVAAKLSKAMGILTIGIVTIPFSDEGERCVKNSRIGIRKMADNVDSLIVVSNDGLFRFINKNIVIPKSFVMSDMVVLQVITAIKGLLNFPAMLCLGLEDIRSVMENKGIVYVGVGKGEGDDKAAAAVKMAIGIPFLGTTLSDASHVIIHMSGDISLSDFDEVMGYVQAQVDENTNILLGLMFDENETDSCVVTVIATGMGNEIRYQ